MASVFKALAPSPPHWPPPSNVSHFFLNFFFLGPSIHIGWESWCLLYAGFFFWDLQKWLDNKLCSGFRRSSSSLKANFFKSPCNCFKKKKMQFRAHFISPTFKTFPWFPLNMTIFNAQTFLPKANLWPPNLSKYIIPFYTWPVLMESWNWGISWLHFTTFYIFLLEHGSLLKFTVVLFFSAYIILRWYCSITISSRW